MILEIKYSMLNHVKSIHHCIQSMKLELEIGVFTYHYIYILTL